MAASDQDFKELASSASVASGIAIGVSVTRQLILEKHGGWRLLVRGILSSAVVAVLVGWGLYALSLPYPVEMAIVGVCAYLGDDILLGLLVIGSLFRNDPASFASRLIDAIRGRAPLSVTKPMDLTPPKEGKE